MPHLSLPPSPYPQQLGFPPLPSPCPASPCSFVEPASVATFSARRGCILHLRHPPRVRDAHGVVAILLALGKVRPPPFLRIARDGASTDAPVLNCISSADRFGVVI
uniref:Uncharacterized protein n=1 Tax=Triticum urartu TaxID=4572 RepID=A0A8R7Q3U0_TRIUA